jgi:hypothetical protein
MKIENKGYYFVEMNVPYLSYNINHHSTSRGKKNFSYRERLRVLAFFISFLCTAGAISQVAKTKRFLVYTYNLCKTNIVDFLKLILYGVISISLRYRFLSLVAIV